MKKYILSVLIVFFCVTAFAKSAAKSLDEVVSDAAEKFIEKAKDGTTVFLGDFNAQKADSTKSVELEKYVMGLLQQLLIDSDSLDVVERNQTEALERERNYQQTGNVRDEDWAELGAEFGAQYAVYGEGKWKSDTYVITLKMTNVETSKIVVSFRGEVSGKDKDLKSMLGKNEETTPTTKKKSNKITMGLTGGIHLEKGKYAKNGEDIVDALSQNSIYSAEDAGYNSLTGNFFFNYRLKYGFGLETGVGFWNGGGELIVKRNDAPFYAEKYKCTALDVPIMANFQFKLFRTSLKFAGGVNLSVPLGCTYVYRGMGSGDKVDEYPEKVLIPGLALGIDYMIPVFKRVGLDFQMRYIKDFVPYEINYKSETIELFKRSGVNFTAGIFCVL